jgi:CRP-like cAMP-binding protein
VHESGFWGQLGDDERKALMKEGWLREFPDSSMLCMEGEPSTHLFILLSGWVKVITSDSDGREVLAAVRGEGDIAGEIAQVVGYRTATLRALGKVRALVIGAEKFGNFLDVHMQTARIYRRIMAEYQHAAHDSQRGMTILSGPRRLARLLLALAERHGTRSAEGIVTTLPLSQEDLASLIGSSRSTVTRALRQWRVRRIIATRQRHIVIVDPAALRRVAGE